MKYIVRLVILSILFYQNVSAQTLNVNFGMNKFRNSDSLSLLETYLSVNASSVNFVKNKNGKLQATVYSEIQLINNETKDTIKDAIHLSSPEFDSILNFSEFNIQRRFVLKPTKYILNLKLKDINLKDSIIATSAEIDMAFNFKSISCSDVQLLTKYKPTEAININTKNGYDLFNYNSTFYPANVKSLKFYFELYNVNKSLEDGEDYIITYSLENAQTFRKFEGIGKFLKQKANGFIVQLGELNIESLPSGNYNFVVEVKNKENRPILIKKKYFERSNPEKDTPENVDMDQTFVAKLSLEEIKKYVSAFRVLAKENESNSINIVEKTNDTVMARNFVYSFWYDRFPANPQYYWEQFKERSDYADENLSAKTRRGYTSELGRVYIKYGKPSYIEDERNDPDRNNNNRAIGASSLTYQIWYYYKIEHTNQTNRMFVFVNPANVGHNYTLIHSDVRGEVFIEKWLGNRNFKKDLYNYGNADPNTGGNNSIRTFDFGDE